MAVAAVEHPRQRSDYDLTGEYGKLAAQRGLADARWYASPIPKDKMRALLERRDGPAVRDTIIWFTLLIGFGVAGALLWGTWWAIIPFALYGVMYGTSSDSRWHECGHGTAFKTDWMNNVMYEIGSFMDTRESVPWRWSHARHHSDTIIVGRDPEGGRPVSLRGTILAFFNLPTFFLYFKTVFLHAIGRMTPAEKTYVPESAYQSTYWHARTYLLIYAGAIALAVGTGSFLPLMYIGLPSIWGRWLLMIYALPQHAGLAENVLDHRLNTRTVYMDPISNFLYWNMGYHIEHHMFPMVPYHNLPRLHALMKADCPPPYRTLLEAHREIWPAIRRQAKDFGYHVQRPLPPSSTATAETIQRNEVITSEVKPDAAGWVDVCELDRLLPGDTLRFDHGERSYAIYRTHIGQLFASDNRCPHGRGELASGFLQGTVIECPKHNGRFDIRDGSVRRPPPRTNLCMYSARERDGKVQVNINSGCGA
jgi:Na+-transporting NADH:ubiquinone oxidoreductase subunit F